MKRDWYAKSRRGRTTITTRPAMRRSSSAARKYISIVRSATRRTVLQLSQPAVRPRLLLTSELPRNRMKSSRKRIKPPRNRMRPSRKRIKPLWILIRLAGTAVILMQILLLQTAMPPRTKRTAEWKNLHRRLFRMTLATAATCRRIWIRKTRQAQAASN